MTFRIYSAEKQLCTPRIHTYVRIYVSYAYFVWRTLADRTMHLAMLVYMLLSLLYSAFCVVVRTGCPSRRFNCGCNTRTWLFFVCCVQRAPYKRQRQRCCCSANSSSHSREQYFIAERHRIRRLICLASISTSDFHHVDYDFMIFCLQNARDVHEAFLVERPRRDRDQGRQSSRPRRGRGVPTPRRDRAEALLRLETALRSRRQDRGHIPAKCIYCSYTTKGAVRPPKNGRTNYSKKYIENCYDRPT